jgi:hypothetical protein
MPQIIRKVDYVFEESLQMPTDSLHFQKLANLTEATRTVFSQRLLCTILNIIYWDFTVVTFSVENNFGSRSPNLKLTGSKAGTQVGALSCVTDRETTTTEF